MKASHVSESALVKRVGRKLSAEDDSRLRRLPYDSRWFGDLGRYYIVDRENCIIAGHLDLEELAREYGCLTEGERLVYPE